MPPPGLCAESSPHTLCDQEQATQAPAMHFLQNERAGLHSRIPPSPRTPGSYSEYLLHACSWISVMSSAQAKAPGLGFPPFPKRFLSPNVPFAGPHIFNTGSIDGSENECPVQLRGHLSPPSKRSQAAPSESSVFSEPVVARLSGILNTCTSASWALSLPSPAAPSSPICI